MKMMEIIKENRPREKLILNGAQYLTNEELLAILIKCGNKDKNAIELSQEIINSAGNLKVLFNMSYDELMKISGIKEAKASAIIAAFELSKRAISYSPKDAIYDNAEKIFDFLNPLLSIEEREVLYVMFLDSKLHLIRNVKYSYGSTSELIVPKQKILADALKYSSKYIIMAHNHPSGDVLPSRADIDITLSMQEAFNMLEMKLIDHIIISNNSFYSFDDEKII